MDSQDKRKNIQELEDAIELGRRVYYCLKRAEEKLDKASDWGLIDLVTANFITSSIKHYRIREANEEIEKARYYLKGFHRELEQIVFPKDISVKVGQLTRLADVCLASRTMDLFVQDRINDTCEEVEKTKKQVRRVVLELKKFKELEEKEVAVVDAR
ncbi:MAG: hypothetical protein HFI93_06570 [Lachnospiraceae bacterium]|nr:hypothetical protein [Lachnospiraceae bacterium]